MSDKVSKLTKIHLIGSLGTKFGKTWELNVKSPAEAIHAIDVNTKGKLRKYLSGPARDKLYKIAVGKKKNVIDREEVPNRSGNNSIYIIPTIAGSESGFGKILAGIALVAVAIALPGAIGATGFLGTASTALVGAGVSLVLGGIVQLLTPIPKPGANDEATRASTVFQGNATTISQGGAPSLIYGRALVAPMPISISVTNNDVSTTNAGSQGTVTRTNLAGGGYQYEYYRTEEFSEVN